MRIATIRFARGSPQRLDHQHPVTTFILSQQGKRTKVFPSRGCRGEFLREKPCRERPSCVSRGYSFCTNSASAGSLRHGGGERSSEHRVSFATDSHPRHR